MLQRLLWWLYLVGQLNAPAPSCSTGTGEKYGGEGSRDKEKEITHQASLWANQTRHREINAIYCLSLAHQNTREYESEAN